MLMAQNGRDLKAAALALLASATVACSMQTVEAPTATVKVDLESTPAADLRTHLDLLLAEHVMIVAKETEAAVYHSDEYAAYTALLGANTSDLATDFGRAYGASAAPQWTQSWNTQNSYLVDYAIGVVTHNDDKANAATAALTGKFAAQFGQMIDGSTGIPAMSMRDLVYQQLLLDKAFIDDVSAQRYSAFYADLDKAYWHSSQLGDALARHAASKFPDKFPGDLSARVVESRVTFNLLTQEHSYLATMATGAAIAKRDAEKTVAMGALSASATRLGKFWSNWDAAVVSSATGADLQGVGLVDSMSVATGASPTEVQHLIDTTVKVIGDQKAKNSKAVADDDRAAATAMQPIADALVQG